MRGSRTTPGCEHPRAVAPAWTWKDLRTINRQRQADRLAELRERSLTTGQVVELVASISDRKGVDRRRARGALLGIRTGNQMLHPAWQFDHRRQDTLPGLPLVLAALSEVAADGLDADAIATTPRADVDGACVAQLLAAGDPVAAARERVPARRITSAASDLHLVRLDGPPAALHLTYQSNLDALSLDDRVHTARLDQPTPGSDDPLLTVSQQLADAVHDWWAATPPPIVSRTRSVPAARSIAFTRSVTWTHVTAGHLRDASALLVALVTHHGFDVPQTWL